MTNRYSAAFAAVAVSAAQDLFELVAPSDCRVAIEEIEIGQYSDFTDVADEILSLLVMRGHTTTGSGGAAVTPGAFNPNLPASGVTVARNNTTVATAGSPVTLLATAFNIRAGFIWRGPMQRPWETLESFEKRRLIILPSTRLVVRTTAPIDELTMNGTIQFEELR